MRKLFSLLCVLMLFCSLLSFGQLTTQSISVKDQISIKSPNVASLGLFDEVPVSYFTGIPNVSIPLYSLRDGKLNVPVSLSYHASGFMPDVQPGWVGTGWALNAGGVITRSVKGLPDDLNTLEVAQRMNMYLDESDHVSNAANQGFFFITSALDKSLWNNQPYISYIAGQNMDGESDEYRFSFPGGSGKFYLDMDGTWKVISDRPIQVIFNKEFLSVPFSPIRGTVLERFDYSKTFSGFTVVDSDGTRYIYGGDTNFIEYSIDFVNQDRTFWQADSWYLKEMIDPSGNKVTYEYEKGQVINQLVQSFSQNFGTGGGSGGFWNTPCGLSGGSYREDYSGRLIYPVYLKKITSSLGSVNFSRAPSSDLTYGIDGSTIFPRPVQLDIYGTVFKNVQIDRSSEQDQVFAVLAEDARNNDSKFNGYTNSLAYFGFLTKRLRRHKLTRIEVKNTSEEILKTFDFDYDIDSGKKRLTLKSVTEGDGKGNYISPYKFDYNSVDRVPYFSEMVDHWGFYNGIKPDTKGLDSDPSKYYNSRNPNFNTTKQGVLNKLTYPTGGVSKFEYELNTAGKQISADRTAIESYSGNVGGLRIKKIITSGFPTASENMEKEYFYLENYKNGADITALRSSGELGGKIQYLFKNFAVKAFTSSADYLRNQFSSISVLPGSSNSNGSHVGYSQVVERRSDKSYTVYSFTNFDNGHLDERYSTINRMVSPYGPYTSLENERGKLCSTEIRLANDVTVHKKETEYIALDKQSRFARSIRGKAFQICPGTNDWYIEGDAYKNYTYAYLPSIEKETRFDINGQNPVISIQNFVYDSYGQLKNKISLRSDLKTEVLKNYYPYDFSSLAPYSDMVDSNMVSPVVRQETWVDDVLQSTNSTVYSKGLSSNVNLILPKQIVQQIQNNAPEARLDYLAYDDRGNILSLSKDRGITTNFIWSHAKKYPVAEITGIDYGTVKNSFNGSLESFSSYFAKPAGPAMDLIGPLNALRSSPLLKDAHINTFTYEPLVGMTSQTDAKGLTTYYEYDSFQRLSNVKDHNGDIVENYSYNLRGELTGNRRLSAFFQKKGCGAGHYGEKIEYVIPENKYFAKTQLEADLLAKKDFDLNAQAYANANGQCFPYGTYVSLCAMYRRLERSGNYEYMYETYAINVFSDRYGDIPNEVPVPISYNYGGKDHTVTVRSNLFLGEMEIHKQYVAPTPEGTEGEVIDHLIALNNSQNYLELNSCFNEAEPINHTGEAYPKIPSVYFGSVAALNELYHHPTETVLNPASIYSVVSHFNEANLLQVYSVDSANLSPALDGYYSLLEIHSSENKGYKYYHIENGKLVSTGWSNPDVAPANPLKTINLTVDPMFPSGVCQSFNYTEYYYSGLSLSAGAAVYSNSGLTSRVSEGYYFDGKQTVYVINGQGVVCGIQSCQDMARGDFLDFSDVEEPELADSQNNSMVMFGTLSDLCTYSSIHSKSTVSVYYENNPSNPMDFYTDSTKTVAVANGYYTFYKTVDNGGNLWFKIQNGKIVGQGKCN